MNNSLLSRSKRLDRELEETIARARSLSEKGKDQLAAVAWNEVEELKTKIAEQKAQVGINFEQYCDDNPSAVGCLIYDV